MGLIAGLVVLVAARIAFPQNASWLPYFRDQTPRERLAEVKALGLAEAVSPICAALTDPDASVVHEAIRVLGQRHDSATFWALVQSIPGGNGWEIANLLAAYREPRFQEALVGNLRNRDAGVRAISIYALSTMGSPIAFRPILRAFSDPNGNVRWEAVNGIVRYNEDSQMDLVRRTSESRDPQVRAIAIMALGMKNNARDLDRMVRALDDPNPQVRFAAATGLGHYHTPEAEARMAQWLTDPSPDRRSKAAYVLQLMGARDEVPALKAQLAVETDPKVKHRLDKSIAKLQ